MIQKIYNLVFNIPGKKILAILLLAGLAIRLVYVFTIAEKWYFFDTIHYDTAAKSIIAGTGFGPGLHYANKGFDKYCLEPVYPVFLALVFFLFGHHFWAARLVQAFLGMIHVLCLYLLAKEIFSRKIARCVVIIATFYPFFIFIAGLLYPTQLFTFLLSATILSFARYIKNNSLNWLCLASILLALSILTGPVLMFGIPLFLVWVFLNSPDKILKRAAKSASVLIVIVMVITPWTVRNYVQFHKFAPVRACLGETRVLEHQEYLFSREAALKQDIFEGQKFSIYCYTQDGLLAFDTFLDDSYLMTIIDHQRVIEFDKLTGNCGLIFYGGNPNRLLRFRASHRTFTKTDTIDLPVIDTAQEISDYLASGDIRYNGQIAIEASRPGWNNLLVFPNEKEVNYFEIVYPETICPMDMRRIALLVSNGSPELSGDGFMIWLHPWKEPDMWQVHHGKPTAPISVLKLVKGSESNQMSDVLKPILRNPVKFFISHFIPEFLNFWSPLVSRISSKSADIGLPVQIVSIIFFTPILLLMIPGLFLMKKYFAYISLLLVPIITISFGYSIFFTEVRYRIPIDGFLIIISSFGVCRLAELIKRLPGKR